MGRIDRSARVYDIKYVVAEAIGIVSRVTREVPGWDEALEAGRAAGYSVYEAIGTGQTLETLPEDVAAALVGVVISNEPCTREVLARMPSLRCVSCIGTGLDHVDLDAASERDVRVTSGDGANADAVADHTMAMLLTLVRGLGAAQQRLHDGQGWQPWPPVIPRDLRETTVALLGFGKIGQAVASRLVPFGATLAYHDPYLAETPAGSPAAPLGFEELLDKADVLSVHVPLTDETRGLVGRRELERLRRGAIVLNLSRGGIVDEGAALDLLKVGHLDGLGLDVFEQEGAGAVPPPRHPRLVATPHMGGISTRIARETRVAAVKRLVATLAETA